MLDVDFAKPVWVVVDRLSVSAESRARLVDSIEICYREGNGEATLEFPADSNAGTAPERLVFNDRFECKNDGTIYQEPEPRLFSFNNPWGACPRCQGFGNTIDFDLNLVVPDSSKSLDDGAIEPWTKPRYRGLMQEAKKFARSQGIPTNVAWRHLTTDQRKLLLEGDPASKFDGVKGFFNYLERKKYKLHVRVFLSRYRGYATCPECGGTRLRPEARAVRVANKSITEICKLTVKEARVFFGTLHLTPSQAKIADKVLDEVRSRLQFLDEVGLDYLTLDRLTSTLSGGESQRIQLATSLGSHLVGALYVLDEPSIGLHPRDTQRLIDILKSLRDLGNTVLVVEHDPDTIEEADSVIDLGPGAGELGGKLLFSGTYEAMLKEPKSITGRYLNGELRIPVPNSRHKPNGKFIRLYGANVHNLQNVDLMIPLKTLTVITGVSGSGKSTIVHDVLYKALTAKRNGSSIKEFCDRIEGDGEIREIVIVDQSPIGRTPRSNPATYLKAFDAIREVFADTPDAKRRGFTAGHFSFNVPGGRCETCQGDGTVTVEMQFLADVELICEECRGSRFKSSVLEVRFHGKNVHDVLQMTVREALTFFAPVPKVTSKLRVLNEIGLGYLRLGQSATTLSGGEAQRLKLASHLTRSENKEILYILDEPTTGLHFDDIAKLLAAFRKLLESAHRSSSSNTISTSSSPPIGSSISAPKAAIKAARSSRPARPNRSRATRNPTRENSSLAHSPLTRTGIRTPAATAARTISKQSASPPPHPNHRALQLQSNLEPTPRPRNHDRREFPSRNCRSLYHRRSVASFADRRRSTHRLRSIDLRHEIVRERPIAQGNYPQSAERLPRRSSARHRQKRLHGGHHALAKIHR